MTLNCRHAYKAPHEETLAEFIMAGLVSIVTLIAAGSWAVTAVAYSLYIILFDLTVAALIVHGRRSEKRRLETTVL
jgi:membrane protein implicated in regulation of membrane protease activity